MTLKEIRTQLINEAQQQDAAAQAARARNDERWVRVHERAAAILRERAQMLEYTVQS